ncbi:hemophore-related protein [Mycolicibacterium septicum]|uniref:hemophore-related protein n=1 Tax=Mycolicibacterium septicum TaxID=98668 RepID=UPI001AF151A6|nr:hemophore-related protein [Mycolicibacterium septicum]QRY49812.1 hemophore-related protein [Mycolicibacterium septicum]
MFRPSLTRLAVGLGGLALSLTAGTGVASAGPNLDSAINTTCSYPQLVSALDAQDPQVRQAFDQSPILQRGLRQFIADPPDKRARTAQDVAAAPMFQPYLGTIEQAFNTCNNF